MAGEIRAMGKTLTLQQIDERIFDWLDNEAQRRGIAVETLVIDLLREQATVDRPHGLPVFHDLDYLAGSWTEEEAEEFRAATADFEKVDPDLWR